MGGFTGVIRNYPEIPDEEQKAVFKEQIQWLIHHYSDDEGYYYDKYASLGFKRSTNSGYESELRPLTYEDEAMWFVFYGDIYNTEELRQNVTTEDDTIATESDAEMLAVLFKKYQEQAFALLRGTFAVLIWDKEQAILYGARDPFGIKPLFYRETDEEAVFASEKKCISFMAEHEAIDTEALQHYLSFQFVPEPMTMTDHIKKVAPGHYFIKKPGEKMTQHRYWQASFTPVLADKQNWIRRIRDSLYDSVKVRMNSDAPIGAFLSGGIDSTIMAAIAKEFKPDIKTFSVGFDREGYSEIDVAKETAAKLGVDNIAYRITPEEYVKALPKIMWYMDDPLADPACVPLYFAAREARKHVDVALSGEGADELFGGYNIYREPESLKLFSYIPFTVKKLLKRVAAVMPEGVRGKSFLERGTTPLRDRYIGNAKMFEEDEKQAFLKSFRKDLSYREVTGPLYDQVSAYPFINQMQYIDIHTWLTGDILLNADRMLAAHSLELRVPFLDKEVFRVASQLPPKLKTGNGTTKSILRDVSRGLIPDHVLDRKKLGFPVPIRHWLKNELYDWAKRLIQESSTDHLLDKSYVLNLLEAHCQDKGDYSRKIWTVLMFMLWHQIFVENQFDRETLTQTGSDSKVFLRSESS
ncbi:asparagine synthase (glutamine-hydrolyzing) [Barrientosiimonas marina]|uniref:asparagine synthase (glutamine-hydrolyzing) n=1 Tax=Lentibacillus kimchii TaxID=1542911 RepID=A0ABW2UQI3_9BACI